MYNLHQQYLDLAKVLGVLADGAGFVSEGVEGFAVVDSGANEAVDIVAAVKALAACRPRHGVEVDLAAEGIINVKTVFVGRRRLGRDSDWVDCVERHPCIAQRVGAVGDGSS